MFLLVGMDSILFDFIPSFWVSTEAILTVSRPIDLFCFVRLLLHSNFDFEFQLKTTANIVGRIALKTSDPQILTKVRVEYAICKSFCRFTELIG